MKTAIEDLSEVSESGTPMFSTEAYYQAPIIEDYNTLVYKEGVGYVSETPIEIPPLISMRDFAAELLEVKHEKDIDVICDKYHVPKRYNIPGGKELLNEVKMVSALIRIYAVSLPIARGESGKSDTANLYDLLHYTRKSHGEMLNIMLERSERYNETSDPEIRERVVKNCLVCLPNFPLIEHFDDFDRDYGCKLQSRYGYDFKKVRRRGAQSPPQAFYHYWDNPSISKFARKKLWGYTSAIRADEDKYILQWDACGLAKRYLAILDDYLAREIKQIQLRLDSVSGVAKLIVENLHSALHLWVLTRIQAKAEYRICKMCGQPFAVGSQSGKTYCNLHKKHEIAYYNKTVRKVCTETDQEENEHRFVVCV